MGIDRRRNYFLVVDVETANDTTDAMVYDLGFAVADKHGNVYERFSFVIADIFCDYKDLMESAYYAHKLPQYYEGLSNGDWVMKTIYTARKTVHALMEQYNITEVWAYNCYFDKNALNKTLRYLSKSALRWFFPYGTEFKCIWNFACDTILQQKSFFKAAKENGWISASGNPQTSAEVAYRYMTGVADFEECHTGAKDVDIEVQILAKCFRQHKASTHEIKRDCWRKVSKAYKEWARM